MIIQQNDKVSYLLRIWESLKAERINWESHWSEVTRLFLPRKDDVFSSRAAGEEKNNYLYDSTPAHANELLASALHSMLTNPTLIWFMLEAGLKKYDTISEVRLWMEACTKVLVDTLNGSNFQTQIHEVYLDLPSLGTAVLCGEEDDDTDIRFVAIPIYQVWVRENSKGIVDSVFREFKWTIRQIVEEFGPNCLEEDFIRNKIDTEEKYSVLHCVLPRNDVLRVAGSNKKSLKNAKYASIHIFLQTKTILRESGFREFRYAVPRWSVISGENLGRGPAMKALPDARMLQVMMKTYIRGAQKVVDPPVQIADDGQYRPFRSTPGGVNYVRNGSDGIRPILTGARVDIGQDVMEDVRNRIRQAFYIDQLQLTEGPQMTATEVRQRTEEKLRLLGPILGRLHNELLKPIIDITFAILERRGKLPPMPAVLKELASSEMRITYLSAIARVQRSSEAQNLLMALSDITPLLEADPTLMDNVDGDKAFRYAASVRGVPEEILRTPRARDEIRQARQQANEQEMAQEQETAQVDNIAKIGALG